VYTTPDVFAPYPRLAAWTRMKNAMNRWRPAHLSYLTPLALTHRFGGLAAPLDTLSLREVAAGVPTVALASATSFHTGIFQFPRGHAFAAHLMDTFVAKFRTSWQDNSARLMKMCVGGRWWCLCCSICILVLSSLVHRMRCVLCVSAVCGFQLSYLTPWHRGRDRTRYDCRAWQAAGALATQQDSFSAYTDVHVASRDDIVVLSASPSSSPDLLKPVQKVAHIARRTAGYARLVSVPSKGLPGARLSYIERHLQALGKPASAATAAADDWLVDLLAAACPAKVPLHATRRLQGGGPLLLQPGAAGILAGLASTSLFTPNAGAAPGWAAIAGFSNAPFQPWLTMGHDGQQALLFSSTNLARHVEYGYRNVELVPAPVASLARVHQGDIVAAYLAAAGGGDPQTPRACGPVSRAPLVLHNALVVPLPGRVPPASALKAGPQGVAVMFWLHTSSADFTVEHVREFMCEVGLVLCPDSDPAGRGLPPQVFAGRGSVDAVARAVKMGDVPNGVVLEGIRGALSMRSLVDTESLAADVPFALRAWRHVALVVRTSVATKPGPAHAVDTLKWSQVHELYIDGLLAAAQSMDTEAAVVQPGSGGPTDADTPPEWMHLQMFAIAAAAPRQVSVDGLAVYSRPLWQADVAAARNRQLAARERNLARAECRGTSR
jgi:hypothetical protein